ncbi:hypothetical protein HZB94_01440 [Candidatus Falkowbacteria bacterium]|nr:hypothetical protein [Candidatus Falkowbacteria bacterium]
MFRAFFIDFVAELIYYLIVPALWQAEVGMDKDEEVVGAEDNSLKKKKPKREDKVTASITAADVAEGIVETVGNVASAVAEAIFDVDLPDF